MVDDNTSNPPVFCADEARESDAKLVGTATQATVWLLLEVNAAWSAKIAAENSLSTAVNDFLKVQQAIIPGARLLFIKRTAVRDTLRFFVVNAATPAAYELHLHDYSELLDLDIPALAAGKGRPAHLRRAPLFLVCTNGKRDKCCARHGLPAYNALLESEPLATWQSSHIGGHRYAPNVLFLPHSLSYGHLTPEQVRTAARDYRRGRLYSLDHYRGRTIYSPPVQAAEIFLRRELNLLEIDALRMLDEKALDNGRHQTRFASPVGEFEVQLRAAAAAPALVSCSPPAEKPQTHFVLQEVTLVT